MRGAPLLKVAVMSVLSPLTVAGTAIAASSDSAPDLQGRGSEATRLSLTLLAGLTLPSCQGFSGGGCGGGELSNGPSIQALALYTPGGTWALGLAAQMARVHWRQSYLGMVDGSAHVLESDLTTGFGALAVRFAPWPERAIAPVVQLALGAGFQTQTGSNFNCNNGFIPSGQIAVGGRARVLPALSLLALVSATAGGSAGCSVSDGPSATPFAGWGLGLHAGAAFDIALGRAAPTN